MNVHQKACLAHSWILTNNLLILPSTTLYLLKDCSLSPWGWEQASSWSSLSWKLWFIRTSRSISWDPVLPLDTFLSSGLWDSSCVPFFFTVATNLSVFILTGLSERLLLQFSLTILNDLQKKSLEALFVFKEFVNCCRETNWWSKETERNGEVTNIHKISTWSLILLLIFRILPKWVSKS